MTETNLLQRYVQMSHSEESDDRAEAARELKSFLRNDAAIGSLVEMLGDSDWRVRRAAVETFTEMRPNQAIPQILMALYDEENAGKRNAAIDVLARYGNDILPFLQPHLNSGNPDVQMFLIQIIGELRSDSFLDFVNQSLQHTDTNIVSAAIVALGKIGHPESVPRLLHFLDGKNMWLTFQAIEASGEMQDSAMIPGLVRLYRDPEYRKPVIHALARFHHPAACQALAEALVAQGELDLNALEALLNLYHAPAPAGLKAEDQQMIRDELKEHLVPENIRVLIHDYERAPEDRKKKILQVLGLAQAELAIPVFLSALEDHELRDDAALGLIFAGREAAEPLLRRLEQDLDEESLKFAFALLNELTPPPALPDPEKWLQHEIDDVRYEAYRMLVRSSAPGIERWLIRGITDPHQPVQEVCREPLLERCRISRALRQEVTELMAQRIRSEDPLERAAALEFSILLEGELSFPLLFRALKDEDQVVREKAVALMSTGYHHDFQKFLISALADEDARVRELSAQALAAYHGPEVTEALLSGIRDEAPWVRMAACESLAANGDEAAVPVLTQQVDSESPIVRAVMLRALGQFRTAESKTLLMKYLNSEDPETRKSSCESLGAFNDSDIVFRLFTMLQNDPDWSVRVAAVRALTNVRPFRLQEALLERLRTDQDPFVRKEILSSLLKLGIEYIPRDVYEFLLDRSLSDSAYEFLLASRPRLSKQIREAYGSNSPAIRRILRTVLN